jgi:hypothetical protein
VSVAVMLRSIHAWRCLQDCDCTHCHSQADGASAETHLWGSTLLTASVSVGVTLGKGTGQRLVGLSRHHDVLLVQLLLQK